MFRWYDYLRRLVTRGGRGAARSSPKKRPTVRPLVEGLEDRRVLSGLPTAGHVAVLSGPSPPGVEADMPGAVINIPNGPEARSLGEAIDALGGAVTAHLSSGNIEKTVYVMKDPGDPSKFVVVPRDGNINLGPGAHVTIRARVPGRHGDRTLEIEGHVPGSPTKRKRKKTNPSKHAHNTHTDPPPTIPC
jgi:hypothetical protein